MVRFMYVINIELFSLTSLRSFSSRYLGIARKRFLPSERCSVVNKENQKTDAAAESRRACSNGRGTRRKAKPNFLRCLRIS